MDDVDIFLVVIYICILYLDAYVDISVRLDLLISVKYADIKKQNIAHALFVCFESISCFLKILIVFSAGKFAHLKTRALRNAGFRTAGNDDIVVAAFRSQNDRLA